MINICIGRTATANITATRDPGTSGHQDTIVYGHLATGASRILLRSLAEFSTEISNYSQPLSHYFRYIPTVESQG